MHEELKAIEGVSVPSWKDFWQWVLTNFTPSYQDEITRYLSEAVDYADLEGRMKILKIRGML